MDDFVQARGRLKREDVMDIVNEMPSSNVVNYVFANQNGLSFANKTDEWGMNQASNSNGAAYADLDNDGDLDLVVNNINQAAFVYQNEAQNTTNHHYLKVNLQGEGLNTQGIGAKATLFNNGKRQTLEQVPSRGYLSSVSPVLHFGLRQTANVDSLIVIWPSGKKQTILTPEADQTLAVSEKEANTLNKPSNNGSAPIFQPTSLPYRLQ